jgi:hypothetical protein
MVRTILRHHRLPPRFAFGLFLLLLAAPTLGIALLLCGVVPNVKGGGIVLFILAVSYLPVLLTVAEHASFMKNKTRDLDSPDAG